MSGLNDGMLIPLAGMAGGFIIAIVAITMCAAKSIARSRAQEASRREIAAYIAEGSMTPEEGARLLEAGTQDKNRRGCL
ncbi:MAG: hypothetical protein ACF8R7_00020 [Phycisphaerales bacterium JB039]